VAERDIIEFHNIDRVAPSLGAPNIIMKRGQTSDPYVPDPLFFREAFQYCAILTFDSCGVVVVLMAVCAQYYVGLDFGFNKARPLNGSNSRLVLLCSVKQACPSQTTSTKQIARKTRGPVSQLQDVLFDRSSMARIQSLSWL
jgi:hypothetical protein